MPVVIAPIAVSNAASFHSCLDTVARERRYLAQIEALPLDKVESFVRESVANDAVQFVALDGVRVVGWADIFPEWPYAISHCGSLGMGILPDYRHQGLGEALLHACIAKAKIKGITRIELAAVRRACRFISERPMAARIERGEIRARTIPRFRHRSPPAKTGILANTLAT